MIRSANIALMSFGCYLETGKMLRDSNNNKFKYFIGNGNNRNLIGYILKKRWWWTQVNDPQQANFVWTQLKHKNTIERSQVY